MTLRISSGAGHAGGHGTGGKKDGSESPEGEKRRNKLGYQRASLACGKFVTRNIGTEPATDSPIAHCRRRKIRCIVQENSGSPQKCANCVRLRRECLFYPVEQQERMEGQRHQSIDNSPGSAESSPRNGGVDISTGARQYDNYTNHAHASGRSQSFNGVLIEPGRTQAPGGYMTHDHEYRAGPESYWQRANGSSSFNQAQTIHPAQGATGNYWSPQETAIPGIYGPLQSDTRNGMRSPYSSSMANAPLHAEQSWQQQQQQYGQRSVMSSLHGSGYSQPHVHHGGTEAGAYTHTPLPSQPDSRQHGAQMPSDGTGVNYTPERIRSASDAGPLVGITWQQSYADQPHPPVSNGPVYTAPGAYAFYNNGSHGGSNGNGHNGNHDAATPGHYHPRS